MSGPQDLFDYWWTATPDSERLQWTLDLGLDTSSLTPARTTMSTRSASPGVDRRARTAMSSGSQKRFDR
ncbi:hypothetical protein ACFU7Y_36470 [Kitasatospora sp. NPDC057542]|uniref:hypothetical protein n=1 Tax=Kitasatospora sp. NPDC057542 TaxID=3346162 RepID=UPI00369DA315